MLYLMHMIARCQCMKCVVEHRDHSPSGIGRGGRERDGQGEEGVEIRGNGKVFSVTVDHRYELLTQQEYRGEGE